MEQNRQLTALQNIGTKLAERLNAVGIFSEHQLRTVGAVKAHQLLREKFPDETLPVCYYLYSFEGAITDQHWDKIGAAKKLELKSTIS